MVVNYKKCIGMRNKEGYLDGIGLHPGLGARAAYAGKTPGEVGILKHWDAYHMRVGRCCALPSQNQLQCDIGKLVCPGNLPLHY